MFERRWVGTALSADWRRLGAPPLKFHAMFALDQMQTVAFAGIVLFIGYRIRRMIAVLARYNIPAPVVGGLLIAAIITAARARGVTVFTFDTALQTPLMIAFFTTSGFSRCEIQRRSKRRRRLRCAQT